MIISIIQLFFLSFVFNTIPAFAPPTSLLLTFFYVQTNLNVFLLTFVTVGGALSGRTILYLATRYLGMKYLADNVKSGYELLRKIVHKNDFITIICMALYCISPLSTVSVFLIAGAAKIKPWPLMIGFAIGRFTQYLSIAFSVKQIYISFSDVLGGNFINPPTILLTILSIIIEIALIFLDWEQLILHKRIAFHKKLLNFKNK